MKCPYIDRPRHIYPCIECKNKHCNDIDGHGNIPNTCFDCRYQLDIKEKQNKKRNLCKRGIRPCKDYEQW